MSRFFSYEPTLDSANSPALGPSNSSSFSETIFTAIQNAIASAIQPADSLPYPSANVKTIYATVVSTCADANFATFAKTDATT